MKIAVLLVTAYRPGKDYIRDAVRSFRASGFWDQGQQIPITIVVCGMNAAFLDPYGFTGEPWIHITTVPIETANEVGFQTMNNQRRCCYGHHLAMREALTNPVISQADYFLICEDDILLARNWHAHLRAILPEIREKYGERFMLSLYRCNLSGMLERFRKGERWYEQDRGWGFLGSQAVLYTKMSMKVAQPVLLDRGVNRDIRHADEAIADASIEADVPILFTVPCLAQHVGGYSLHQSGFFHEAELFHSSVPMDVPRVCPKCGVPPGSRHRVDCEVERCSECGFARVLCKARHFDHDPSFARWTGFLPGELEAKGLGLQSPDDLGFDNLYKLFYLKPRA